MVLFFSREQGSKREMNEEERLLRLFVVVPKTINESDIRQHFNQFGDIDYVSIVKDHATRESKGFAYVKYHRYCDIDLYLLKYLEIFNRLYIMVFLLTINCLLTENIKFKLYKQCIVY